MSIQKIIPQHLDIPALIKLLADPLDIVVVLTDAKLDKSGPHVLYTNPAYEKMTGYKSEEAIGNTPRMLQGPRTNKALLKQFINCLKKGEHAQTTVMNYRKDGGLYSCNIAAWPIMNALGEITHFLALERELPKKRGRPAKDRHEDIWWMDALSAASSS